MTVLLLFTAALLEAGGDALISFGLRATALHHRLLGFGLGAAVLFAYGCTVNAPAWNFGRLLGVYVVFFFLVAQVISWIVFHQPPGRWVWVGGALIVAGGLAITFG